MSNNQVVVVVASNFESFIGSMKANLKLGYATCSEATYMNGFFRARLEKGTDDNYVARLSGITGKERENVIDLVVFLGSKSVQATVPVVDVVEKISEDLQTEAVQLKVKRTPRARKPKQ